MGTSKRVEWFVACATPEGNEMVAAFLSDHSISDAESAFRGMPCKDGAKRDMWRISSQHINAFRRAFRSFPHSHLRFFKRTSRSSCAEEARFLTSKKKKRVAKTTEAVV